MSTVHCRVTDGEIAARACVDQQIEKRCFCPKAVLAINEVQQIATPKSRLEEQLDTCKAAAQAMLKKPADQRYAGPALRKLRGEPEPAEIPLPAPKNTSTEDDAMPSGPGKPAPSQAFSMPERRVVPDVDEEEDWREAAIQAREDQGAPPARRAIGKDPRVPRLPRKPSENPGDAIRALKIGLPKEDDVHVPKRICSTPGCKRELRIRNGVKHDRCRRCRMRGTAETPKPVVAARICAWKEDDGCKTPLTSRHSGEYCVPHSHVLRERERRRRKAGRRVVGAAGRTRKPLPPERAATSAVGETVVGGLDVATLSLEQLNACAYELRRRIGMLEDQRKAAEFALAGEPPMARTGT
jgi:hypothetical protein